jgi:hypothetical protein
MKITSRTESVVSYFGRYIEVVLPLALLFSLASLGWGAFADRAGFLSHAGVWATMTADAVPPFCARRSLVYAKFTNIIIQFV